MKDILLNNLYNFTHVDNISSAEDIDNNILNIDILIKPTHAVPYVTMPYTVSKRIFLNENKDYYYKQIDGRLEYYYKDMLQYTVELY